LPTYDDFLFTLAVACYRKRESIQRCHVQSSLSSFCDGNLKKERAEGEQENKDRQKARKNSLFIRSFSNRANHIRQDLKTSFLLHVLLLIELYRVPKYDVDSSDLDNNDEDDRRNRSKADECSSDINISKNITFLSLSTTFI